MTLEDLRLYLNRLDASKDRAALYKEARVLDTRTDMTYTIRLIDEGRSISEISIKTLPDKTIDFNDDYPL